MNEVETKKEEQTTEQSKHNFWHRLPRAGRIAIIAAAVVAVALVTSWCALVGLGFLAIAAPAVRTVLGGATGPGLIPVLQQTGLAELLWAALVAAALVVCG